MRTRKVFSTFHSTLGRAVAVVLVGQMIPGARLASAQSQTGGFGTNEAPPAIVQKIEKPIVPNRTLPVVTPPRLDIRFGDNPTSRDVMAARVLPQPLLPVGGVPTADETRSVAQALIQFATKFSDATPLEQFLEANPSSPWRASILANMGVLRWNQGYYSRAARYWDEAWAIAKHGADSHSRAVADFALGEWMTQAVTFGKVDALQARFEEIGSRPIRGRAGTRVNAAREGMWQLINHHEMATFSGPEALKAFLRESGGLSKAAEEAVGRYHPGAEGTTLSALADLGTHAGISLSMRHVSDVKDLPVPSIVHLKSEHYSLLVKRDGDAYVLRDPILGGEVVLSSAAMKDEASGYALVRQKDATIGRPVTKDEAATVVGHCAPGAPYEDEICGCFAPEAGAPNSGTSGTDASNGNAPGAPPSPCGGVGMPVYRLHPVTASVMVFDTPMAYQPPAGPSMAFTLRYNQRTARVEDTPAYGNVGPKWTTDWFSYVQDNNNTAFPPYSWTAVVARGEGFESFNTYSGYTHWRSLVSLVKVSDDPVRWERRLPDGTVEVFAQPDRAASLPNRKVFLTEVITPQGQSITYTYDSSFRLVAVTDAIGQVTTLEYLSSADPLLLTKVTDPFDRTSLLTYDAAGRLESITDAIGMVSTFVYDATDTMVAMVTPYGTTSFRQFNNPATGFRGVEASDPEGGTERLEYRVTDATLSQTAPTGEVPTGFSGWNGDLHKYNSLYWSKQAMAEAPGDVSRAVITHWLIGSEAAYDAHAAAFRIPHSVKRPLESRVWYAYPNQTNASYYGTVGTGRAPTKIARVLPDSSTQLTQFAYNALGMVTSVTDPNGRQTTYTYATNGLDLLEVRQIKSGGSDLLATLSDYNGEHLPETVTDAAGEVTTFTYTELAQPLTITNAKSETTTFAYATSGAPNLVSVTGPVSGATVTYTYDSYGRVRTETGSDSYAVTIDYDALNRVTRLTYPDSTFDEITYQRLNIATVKDRLGRMTRNYYDNVGRLTATRDPLGRVIRQEWCGCGNLKALVDANGKRTSWDRDALGRVVREERADGVTDTEYVYDSAGRLSTVTDAEDQVKTYAYFTDGSLASIDYTNENVSTPGVSWTYDSVYPRLATMVDGLGTTTYSYKTPGQLGAGAVATIDGPRANDTLAYTYDELGRLVTRTLNSVGPTWTYDDLGRVDSEVNALGTFSYTYDGHTRRIASATYPNGQTTLYSYFNNAGDRRLQTLHNRNTSAQTISKFDYTYDVVGNISTWQRQAGSTVTTWTYGYDTADQLTAAVLRDSSTPAAILANHGYRYDAGGNRTNEQIGDVVTGATYDVLNRLVGQSATGSLRIAGTLSEAARVTIDGAPAAVDSADKFVGSKAIAAGTHTFTVAATDYSGNLATQEFEVTASSSSRSFTHDANGNLTGDGTRSFEWDAENRLIAVVVGAHRSEFTYDGLSRRTRIVEKENGTTVRDAQLFWDGTEIIEERLTTGELNRFFTDGETHDGSERYLTRDHLGSIREVTDSNGSLVTRNDYDSYGRKTRVVGTDDTRFGYTGHYSHTPSGLNLAPYRAYDAETARWLSSDPLGLGDGLNLHAYVAGNPINLLDSLGLSGGPPSGPPPIPVPPAKDGSPNRWVPKPGTGDRPIKWSPEKPVEGPKGGQPAASFDEKNNHWDHDDGRGNRTRYDRTGKPVQHERPGLGPKEPSGWPSWFPKTWPGPLPLTINPCLFNPSLCQNLPSACAS